MHKKLRTPFIKPRVQNGTFYTFPSALEDIGVNINETRSKVALSHYVLLDIKDFDASTFGIYSTASSYQQQPGDYIFAQSLENYVFNMETVLRNQETYNFSLSKTVSERCFWKWLQKYGFMQLSQSGNYYKEDSSVIKAFGKISSSAQRSDDGGIYNETFVQIPSSFGKMTAYFKPYVDGNMEKTSYRSNMSNQYIENISPSEIANEKITATGLSALAIYDGDKSYSVSDDTDLAELVLSLDDLRSIYNDQDLTYDDLAISKSSGNFTFNAILIYYSIYDSDGGEVLATNAYGLLLLDNAEVVNGKYRFKELTKEKSSNSRIGSSFSFRLNVKTSSIYNVSDIVIEDNSTPAYDMSVDFNDTIKNLNDAISTLKSNANTIYNVLQTNKAIRTLASNALDKVDDIEHTVATLQQRLLDLPNTQNHGGLEDSKDLIDKVLAKIDVEKVNGQYKMHINRNETFSGDNEAMKLNQALIGPNDDINLYSLLAMIVARMKKLK